MTGKDALLDALKMPTHVMVIKIKIFFKEKNLMERKTKVLGFAAVLIAAAMVMIGCNHAQGNSGKEDKKPNTPSAAREKTYQVV